MSIFFILFPFIFLIYFVVLLKKTKYITHDLKMGKKCYSCKEDINTDIVVDFDVLLSGKDNFNLCESCKRDETINKLVELKVIWKIHRSKEYPNMGI